MRLRWWALGVCVGLTILPALLLTGVRLLHPRSGLGVVVTAFVPYAIPLYLLAFAGLVALALRRPRSRPGWALVLAVLLPLALQVWWVRGLYGDAPAAVSGGFTLMTANLRLGEADPASVIAQVREHQVDVLVTEETSRWLLHLLVADGIDDYLPYRYGVAGAGPVGTLTLSRYPLTEGALLPLPLGGHRVTVAVPDGPVTVVAVHLRRPKVGGAQDWWADHAVLRRELATADGPVVVAGDLNSTDDHEPVRRLEADGFTDAVDAANAGWTPTWPRAGRLGWLGLPAAPMVQIDHILLRGGVRASSAATSEIEGTDHLALLAHLSL